MNYYNEIDPHAAQWLRNLIDAGLIPAGDVDTRSIEDVIPNELRGYTQCHFFAGIGGWPLALHLAGWPESRPVWTGSCPCQPFSAAGKGAGFDDERHLWPAWQHLIAQCRPPVVFGEQVAAKGADAWVDLVHADLEGMGYAFGSIPFPAAGIGAPHIRDRNYWVADAYGRECDGVAVMRWDERDGADAGRAEGVGGFAACGDTCGVADCASGGHGQHERNAGAMGGQRGCHEGQESEAWGLAQGARDHGKDGDAGPTNGHWRAADWLGCTDGKWRPVEPGTFPLAHGIPGRVGRLRGYGNAIVPQAAAEFVMAYAEAIGLASELLEAA